MEKYLLETLLHQVEKPTRYIGAEWNAIHKDPGRVKIRIGLVFPDVYELGLGNLGLHLLYDILNRHPSVWAERTYLPGSDMACLLKENGIPLFMLESKDPVGAANAVGITLQSELTYVNVLKIIELAQLPLYASDRDDAMPLLFAGGPGAYNPEPLAPFIDFFVVGDGEEVIEEIAECLLQYADAPKQQRLQALAALQGVYVPALYPVETLPDGSILPIVQGAMIQSRAVSSLENTPFPISMITPYMQMVHDGLGIEILRGCTHGCRFCQAGMIARPVRERTPETISSILETGLSHTGFENATLLSLSSCDHRQAVVMLRQAAAVAQQHQTSLSLPSLRLDRFSMELADSIASMRRSGLTFAPEAGTERLRSVINKSVSDEQLIELAQEAWRKGWSNIKTYFMIGLPTETDEDIDAIAELCIRLAQTGKRITSRAMVRTGISTFVPKPFTPFQWAAQLSLEDTCNKQRRLAALLRPHRNIKFGKHAPESSFIEGLLSRADRRAAPLLESVLRLGGGYETWDEKLNIAIWRAAIAETAYPVESMLAERPLTARLPWSHIDAQVQTACLKEEWERARQSVYTPDCRTGICNLCGAMRRFPEQCAEIRRECGPLEPQPHLLPPEPVIDADIHVGIQRIGIRVGRSGLLRFLSHLEFAQAWIRALRRTAAPLCYSQGFHAHPKVSFAAALPVGEESEAELMEITLYESRLPNEVLSALQQVLPQGLTAYEAWEMDMRAPALMAAQCGAEYRMMVQADPKLISNRLQELQQQSVWAVDRSVKSRSSGGRDGPSGRKIIRLDIRPLITELELIAEECGESFIRFITMQKEGRLAKPKEMAPLLGLSPEKVRIRKTKTFLSTTTKD